MGKVGIEAITEVVDNVFIGIEGIVKVLDDFLAEFELKAVPSADFYYQQDTNEIGFALVVSDFASTQFQQYVCRLCPELHADTFLLSFFHELGHHHTLDEIPDEVYRKNCNSKAFISRVLSDGVSEKKKKMLYDEYFNLEVEREATAWAIDYILANREKVNQFWNKVAAALAHFYEINDIEM